MNTPGAGFNFGGGGGGGGISATDPTTPVATATVPAVRVDQDADVGTYLISFRPATYNTQEGTDPPIGAFNFVFLPPRDFSGSGTRKDRPFAMGWNFGTAGGGTPNGGDGVVAQLSTAPTFGETFEDFYNIAGTTLVQCEWYVASTPAGDDGTGQSRVAMAIFQYPTLACNTPPENGFFLDIDNAQSFTITAAYKNVGTLSTRTSDTAGTVTVTAAHNIVTGTTMNVRWLAGGSYGERTGVTIGAVSATTAGSTVAFSGGSGDVLPAQTNAIELRAEDTIAVGAGTSNNGLDTVMEFSAGAGILLANNSRGLKAKNSTGTPRDLMWWRNDNFIIIGDFGQQKIYMAGYVKTFGVATSYTTSTGTMDDATFKAAALTTETPDDGAIAVTNYGGVRKIWIRAGGAWYSATCT